MKVLKTLRNASIAALALAFAGCDSSSSAPSSAATTTGTQPVAVEFKDEVEAKELTSKALLTTQVGLVVALPGIFGSQFLKGLRNKLAQSIDGLEFHLKSLVLNQGDPS